MSTSVASPPIPAASPVMLDFTPPAAPAPSPPPSIAMPKTPAAPPRRRLPWGVLLSVLLHGAVLTPLYFATLSLASQPAEAEVVLEGAFEAPRDIFDEVAGSTGEQTLEMRPLGGDVPPSDDAPLRKVEGDTNLQDLGASLQQGDVPGPAAPAGGGGGRAGAEGVADGLGQGGGGAGGGFARFGELKASGRRIVYCVDRSASMSENDAMRFCRDELVKSIDKLPPTVEFQIVFYNDQPEVLPTPTSKRGMMRATAENREWAIQKVLATEPAGGTEHSKALAAALKLNPDVLFVFTDAEDTEREIREVVNKATLQNQRRRGPAGAPASIHVMQFWHDAHKRPMDKIRELAEQNNGSYQLVNAAEVVRGAP